MEFEHAFHQAGFMAAWQMLIAACLLTPGILGGMDSYRKLAGVAASYVVSFGPMALLIFMLYRVTQIG